MTTQVNGVMVQESHLHIIGRAPRNGRDRMDESGLYDRNDLYVEFKSGKTCLYLAVESRVLDKLFAKAAEKKPGSVGSYFNRWIRGMYQGSEYDAFRWFFPDHYPDHMLQAVRVPDPVWSF